MTPISDEYFQEQLEAKTELLYQKHAELTKVKAILSSTETELRGADLVIAGCKDRIAILEAALEEAREYFAERADVVDGPDGYESEQRPNAAMGLMITCDAALGRVS